MSKVALKYMFIFDPADTWTAKSGFEGDLAALLRSRGLEAETIKMQGDDNTCILYIQKIKHQTPTTQKQHSVAEQFANLRKGIGK